jgi:hypothetical protein
MTYEIVDMDGGDVLGVYDAMDAASHRLRILVEQHPDLIGDVALVAIDERGERVGNPVFVTKPAASA